MAHGKRVVLGLSSTFVLMIALTLVSAEAFAQSAGTVLRDQMDKQKGAQIEKAIVQPKEKTAGEMDPATVSQEPGGKVRIVKIQIDGNTLLSQEELAKLIAASEGTDMNIGEIRALVARITALYREKGYVTSRAYLPPQTIENGLLLIKVIEGKMGDVTIQGNRYFSAELLRRKIAAKPGDPFDYQGFLRSMRYINEHADREAVSSLVPGKVQGTTDVVLQVKDRRPYHVGLEVDNWASRELGRYRYALNLQHNNFLGKDDLLYVSAIMTDGDRMELVQGRYVYPLTNTLSVGMNAMHSETSLGGDFEDLQTEGSATVYGLFARKEFINRTGFQWSGNLAFDWKDIKDLSLGQLTAHDELRIVRVGSEWDFTDNWGRNIVGIEEAVGIPDIMGAMDDKDEWGSRLGSGGKFNKEIINYYRLQAMPWETSLLLKNNAQHSNINLPSAEQFQIGGPSSVRAYKLAEYSGDSGFYSAAELSFPLYGLSRDAKLPGTQVKLYDALRLVTFYDIGSVRTKVVAVDEKASHTLKGYGAGVRFNPSNDTAFRIEAAFPHGPRSSDNAAMHVWFDLQQQF